MSGALELGESTRLLRLSSDLKLRRFRRHRPRAQGYIIGRHHQCKPRGIVEISPTRHEALLRIMRQKPVVQTCSVNAAKCSGTLRESCGEKRIPYPWCEPIS